ncbi:MAG: hypothetical protein K6A23_00470 [Butyrivibrio sp.]|nr:hypothetical protein [Butyrivibrio sp.]
MSSEKIDELQKLYDDTKVDEFFQEICEYYATKGDYADSSYEEEIEPEEIIEPVYILFCLQNREGTLDTFSYLKKKYPALFEAVSPIYNKILINMDYQALQSECEHQLVQSFSKTASAEIYDKVEILSRTSKNLTDAVDSFYSWLHTKK